MRGHALIAAAVIALALPGFAVGQIAAYNPYADSQEMLAPVAPDGTIRWGTFYKSAALQKTYERLWSLGACRGTNQAITVPVEMNKLSIDSLAEEEFRGTVVGATGTIKGGMLAFSAIAGGEPKVAVLHPAGVSKLAVSGQAPASILRPGMTVRLHAQVDGKGRGAQPLEAFEIVTLPADFKPVAVRPDRVETIAGEVVQVRNNILQLRVNAGRIRRLSLPLAADAVATIEAAQLELVEPGDTVELKGRLWSGEGCMGEGTVFASKVIVTKVAPGRQARAGGDALGIR
jgi:hypothetical protein